LRERVPAFPGRARAAAGSAGRRVSCRVPGDVAFNEVPREVAVEVPAIRRCRYMMVNDHVVLVDPLTSKVVADFTD